MGFFLGLFLGAALGLGLIVGFARYQNTRSMKRRDLAETIAAFARMTVQDSRKILPPKLTWLNHHLDKIWPYVNEAASELIRDNVEPILEQYRPAILASIKFSKLTLGTVAPQFTGVSMVDGDVGEIIMELELQWDGNPSIIIDIETRVGVKLPIQGRKQPENQNKVIFLWFARLIALKFLLYSLAKSFELYHRTSLSLRNSEWTSETDEDLELDAQVKNIGFTGVFRLIFKPLVDELPCFGAVLYSLRHKKNLDFTLKVVGGEITAIPGISDAIEGMIRDAIEDSITWPVRKIVPILPGDYSDLELKPVGTLEVKLIEAKELTNKDFIGKSDPYAELHIRPLRDRTKTSKTINNSINPIWNEHFEFIIEDAATQHLTVKVYDDEGIQASEFIGCAQFALKDLEPGKVKDVWLKLVKDLQIQRDTKNRGQVHLELLYCPFGIENAILNPFNPDFRLTSLEKALKQGRDADYENVAKSVAQRKKDVIVRGVLSVTVISAEDLPAVDLLGKSDPFVVLTMKKSEQKNKTRVLNETLNPVWNQTFDFVVEDALHDLLMLEVYDHDTFGKEKMGRCIMTLTRAILEGEFTDTFALDGSPKGKLALHIKWTAQPIIRD